MESVDNKANEKACIKRFEEFITKEVGISDMFWILDAVMANYAKYIVEDSTILGGSEIESSQLYYMKLLRDLFIQPKKV